MLACLGRHAAPVRNPRSTNVPRLSGSAGQAPAPGNASNSAAATRPAPSGPAAHPGRSARPTPNARCGLGSRSTSNASGRRTRPGRGWPRRAAPRSSGPARPTTPPTSTGCGRGALEQLQRGVEAQHLLDRQAPASSPGRSPRAQHRDQPVAEDVDRRLVAGVEQQHDGRDQLVVGEARSATRSVIRSSRGCGAPLADQLADQPGEVGRGARRRRRPPARRRARPRTSARSPATSPAARGA